MKFARKGIFLAPVHIMLVYPSLKIVCNARIQNSERRIGCNVNVVVMLFRCRRINLIIYNNGLSAILSLTLTFALNISTFSQWIPPPEKRN